MSNVEGAAYKKYSRLLAEFGEMRSHRAVIHEHAVRRKELLPKYFVHLLHFGGLQLSASVGEAGQRYFRLP